jgi:hypothetical protein
MRVRIATMVIVVAILRWQRDRNRIHDAKP